MHRGIIEVDEWVRKRDIAVEQMEVANWVGKLAY